MDKNGIQGFPKDFVINTLFYKLEVHIIAFLTFGRTKFDVSHQISALILSWIYHQSFNCEQDAT